MRLPEKAKPVKNDFACPPQWAKIHWEEENLVDVDGEHLEDLGASYDDDIFNLMYALNIGAVAKRGGER